MANKKVAYVATMFSHLAVFHIRFMKNLQSEGHQVHAYGKPDHCKDEVEQESIVCRDIPFNRNPFHLSNVQALRKLTRWFKQEQYDWIHVHTPNASVICRISAFLTGRGKVVYTAHGFHFYKGAPLLNWIIYFPIEWFMSFFTDVLITINREDYERVRKFPVRKKVVYIPGVGVEIERYRGLEAERMDRLRTELGIKENEFIVLCLAELNHNKNHEQLIYSVLEMRQKGIPVVCLLAGAGVLEDSLKDLVKRLHMEGIVRFLGFRKDSPDLMNICDVVVLLSKREGLPKVLLEALAAGKPMVVTDVRGNRELVVPKVNGYVVSPGDIKATSQALAELYENADLRSEMGRNSYVYAAHYEAEHIGEKIEEVYALLH